MLRLSRSHDQNRRRAGETAGKAATLAVQCDVLSGRTWKYCWRTQKWWKTERMNSHGRELLGQKSLYCNWWLTHYQRTTSPVEWKHTSIIDWCLVWAKTAKNSITISTIHFHPTLKQLHVNLWYLSPDQECASAEVTRLHSHIRRLNVLQNIYQSNYIK